MGLLDPREPASAWTHGAGLLLALAGILHLWRRSAGGPAARRLALLVYGLSLAACYGASTLYHGLRLPPGQLETLDRLDRAGIFLLIAGTYTPLAGLLPRGPWRWGTLAAAWGIALVASAGLALAGSFPSLLSTSLYLAMGWGGVLCYGQLARVVPPRSLRLLVAGGLFYSVGAVLNSLGLPRLWPGVFGAHDLFHLFVMAGSLAHYLLILRVVAGADQRPSAEPGWSPGPPA